MDNECPLIWLTGGLDLLLFEGGEWNCLDKGQESNWRQRMLNQHHPGLSSSLVLWTLTEGAEASSPLPELQSPPLWKKHLAGSMTDWL